MELELGMSIILTFNKFESDISLLVAVHAAKSLAKWHIVVQLLEWCSAKARLWEPKFVGAGSDLCTTVNVDGTLIYYFHNLQFDGFSNWE